MRNYKLDSRLSEKDPGIRVYHHRPVTSRHGDRIGVTQRWVSWSTVCETLDKVMQFCSALERPQLSYALQFCALCFVEEGCRLL